MVKKLISAVIAIFVPLLYSFLISKFPDLPISQNELIETFLWIAGLFTSGAFANSANTQRKNNKKFKA